MLLEILLRAKAAVLRSVRILEAQEPAIDPEQCIHPEWTPSYEYTRGPNGEAQCRVRESYCKKCGFKSRGSGQ